MPVPGLMVAHVVARTIKEQADIDVGFTTGPVVRRDTGHGTGALQLLNWTQATLAIIRKRLRDLRAHNSASLPLSG
jgi:hypothetical protein